MGRTRGRSAARMWAGTELRRRWLALVALGLLAGISAGLATAAVAGARRTGTSWDRLREVTHASDAVVFTSQAGIYFDDELRYDEFAELPYVEGVGAFGLMYVSTPKGGGGLFLTTYGDWLTGVDAPRIVEGRAPRLDAPHEVVISPPLPGGELEGMGVGDTIPVHVFTQDQLFAGRDAEPEGPEASLEIVGISNAPFNLAAIPSDGDVYVGPAFREEYGPGLAVFSNLMVDLADPDRDVARLEEEVARTYPGRSVPVYDLNTAGKRVTNGTDLERSGLLLFALAVAVAALVIIGQALTRSVRASGDDVPTLTALGFSRGDRALALALPHAVSALVAAAAAVIVAVVLSPRFPIGLGREVDPDVGWHLDLPVVVGGAVLVALVLGAAVVWSAWRAARAVSEPPSMRRSGIASLVLRAGAPVTVSTGVGLALDPGRGQRALPTRPALAGAIVGVLGVVGGLTLAAGINDATDHAARFGTVWDAELFAEENAPVGEMADEVAGVRGVEAVARLARVTLPVGDVVVPFYAIDDVEGATDFVMLGGAAPRRGEVALGPDTAAAFGVGIGDDVEVGAGGPFRVSGLVLLPTTAHSSFDQGGWMGAADIARSIPDTQREALAAEFGADPDAPVAEVEEMIFDWASMLVRYAPGADVRTTTARIERVVGSGITVEVATGPADQQNLRNTRPLPLLFAGFAFLLAVGALLHVSSTVLRRRRKDLAVLRVLGITRRQTRACLAWQATTLAVVGLVIGVPLGVILGRVAWRAIADETPMVYVPPTAALALLLAVPCALLVANAIAALPGERAARLRPAEVLRTE